MKVQLISLSFKHSICDKFFINIYGSQNFFGWNILQYIVSESEIDRELYTFSSFHQTSSLLRVATFEDHLFVLNHILRCPAGVSQWGVELVQCPVCPMSSPVAMQSGVSNVGLDHIITALATVLMPIKYV